MGAELNKIQRPSFETLLTLGVATGKHNDRELARFPAIEAVLAISGESWLRDAIPSMLGLCVKGGRDMADRIQSDCTPFADVVDAARAANRKRVFDELRAVRESGPTGKRAEGGGTTL